MFGDHLTYEYVPKPELSSLLLLWKKVGGKYVLFWILQDPKNYLPLEIYVGNRVERSSFPLHNYFCKADSLTVKAMLEPGLLCTFYHLIRPVLNLNQFLIPSTRKTSHIFPKICLQVQKLVSQKVPFLDTIPG